MHLPKLKILIIGILLVLFHLAPVAAVTLTVGTVSGAVDATLTIPITVDDPEGIAGAAFSIVYDPALNVMVSSDFFDTFYSQFKPLATTGAPDPDGGDYGTSVFPVLDAQDIPTGDIISIPAIIDSVDYFQPLITNSVSNGQMVSAVRCLPGPTGGLTVLFSLNVQLNGGESAGTYPIQIIPSVLNNVDAGYAPEGETIDLLIGSDLSEPVESSFSILLDDDGYQAYVINGQAEFIEPVDSDNDGLSDNIEDAWCTDSHDTDTDDDGIPDGVEDANQNGKVDYGETNPCKIDTDGDGIQDGTESGLTVADVGLDTNLAFFVPDADPSTKTNPIKLDTDGDGISDGDEDLNKNGRVDPGETDPNPRKAMPWIPLLLLD